MRDHVMLTLLLATVGFATVGTSQAAGVSGATPADSVGRRRIQPLPALGSAPETGLQYGATVLAVWEPAAMLRTRPSSLTASAMRTVRAQTRLRIDAERWTGGDARRIAGSLQWQEFPLPFFGIGDRSPASAEDTYTPTGTEATLTVQQRVSGSWYALAGMRHLEQRIRSDTGGTLAGAVVRGRNGGTITEWSAGVLTDTRDNLFAPRGGHLVQATYARSLDGVWSDHGYGTLRLDARRYQSVGRGHVIAAQLQVTSIDGAAPFDQLALVGNSDILRGYARGRYRDRSLTAAQGEYRSPHWHRVGAVVFGGAGIVSPSLAALTSHRVLPTYGAGVRATIDQRQRTGVRLDYGRGADGSAGLYIGFNNAF